jgi:hypothetical protein
MQMQSLATAETKKQDETDQLQQDSGLKNTNYYVAH